MSGKGGYIMSKRLQRFASLSFLLVVLICGLLQAGNTGYQRRPILLGTSGSNINDSSRYYCCGGTLGALVDDGDAKYILSNNHVLARVNIAALGEQIIQPGLIDLNCAKNTADTVANLSDFVTIRFKSGRSIPLNDVDAAIAQIIAGDVNASGAILDIGDVGSQTVAAVVGQAVKKSGRTTGLTKGTVGAVGVTVDVGYSQICGGAANLVARFRNQILINTPGFCAAGDSGSLIVEDVNSKPRAVGLLFAGSADSNQTLANPIGAVLDAFGVTMPGGVATRPTGTIKGAVTNSSNGKPIGGATVAVDSGELATTDINGNYIFMGLPTGAHLVEALAAGYQTQIKTATVSENHETTVNFSLQPVKGKVQAYRGAVEHALSVKNLNEREILQNSGVVGTGVSLSEAGEPVIEVYLESDSPKTRAQIPKSFDDVNVRVKVTGRFEAF
jgi:hypothetical protein